MAFLDPETLFVPDGDVQQAGSASPCDGILNRGASRSEEMQSMLGVCKGGGGGWGLCGISHRPGGGNN